MAKDQNRRLNPKEVQDDLSVLDAIVALTPTYTPANAQFSVVNLQSAKTAMTGAQATETQKQGEVDAARDAANAKEWAFHNAILEAKKQVAAQYGSDSDQVQAIGLKKKSEYKKPGGRKAATTKPA